MKKIYITGISGTGKTTIAKELTKRGVYSFSIDEVPELCVWRNKITNAKVDYEAELNEDFIDSHDWVCDIEYLKELMKKAEKILVVLGYAHNQKEYLDLFDEVLLLQCPPDIFIERIKQRKDNDFGKDESTQKLILSKYKKFENNLLENGAISIDTNRELDTVVNEILSRAKK